MNYEKYEDIKIGDNNLDFGFVSVGPKGCIKKLIQFSPTNMPEVYNLAFGNLNADGTIDDMSVDNNKDRNKILATVAHVVYLFCQKYSGSSVVFFGSTPERTRLYRMAISLNLEELSVDFEICSIVGYGHGFKTLPFRKEINCLGFFIRKKT